MTLFSESLMLHQSQLSSGFLRKISFCSPNPKHSQAYRDIFPGTIMYVRHACTNSHIRRGRVEEILELEWLALE